MPELPDVEVFKRRLDANALHRRIRDAQVKDAGVVKYGSGRALERALRGAEMEGTHRYGKWLFAELDGGPWWVIHFGMTGLVDYVDGDPPRHTRLLVRFDDGKGLAYVTRRRLGSLGLVDDPDAFIEDRDLGPDALALDRGAFLERFQDRRGRVKSALMNQEVVAGLGNVYADEILFDAGVHPEAGVDALDERTARRIHSSMRKVLRGAIDRGADPGAYPRTWLTPHRDDPGGCPRDDGRLRKTKLGGRPTVYCTTHQST